MKHGTADTCSTVIGQFTNRMGAAMWPERDMLRFTHPSDYRTAQPSVVPVHVDHRQPSVGEVLFIERTADGLSAVAVVDGDFTEFHDRVFWSAQKIERRGSSRTGTDAVLVHLALTATPAGLGLAPVSIYAGDVRNPTHRQQWRQHGYDGNRRLATRSVDYDRSRGSGPHQIVDHDEPADLHARADGGRPRGPLLYRGSGRILAVR